MTKQEYLDRLGALLSCLPSERVEESKSFYAEMIADRMEEGMSEEEAVAALESPGEAAEAILDELPAVPRAVAKTRRKSRTLLWTLVIVGSPVWLSLGIGFAAVALAVYVAIWAMVAAIWIFTVALLALVPLWCLFAVWGVLAGNAPYAIVSVGVALMFAGFGLLCANGAWLASKQLVRLSHLWVKKALSPFKKDASHAGEAEDIGIPADKPAGFESTNGGEPKRRVVRTIVRTRMYRAVAGGLAALGLVLAGAGFVTSGFDPEVFQTHIDMREGTFLLGSTQVEHPEQLPLNVFTELGSMEVSLTGVTNGEEPAEQ